MSEHHLAAIILACNSGVTIIQLFGLVAIVRLLRTFRDEALLTTTTSRTAGASASDIQEAKQTPENMHPGSAG